MTKIDIRHMPEGYPADCWIVTGPIYSSEVRYYRNLKDAKKYAKELIASFKIEGNWLPAVITIEERQSDAAQRLPINEQYRKDN